MHDIEFSNISFSYKKGVKVFDNLNLSFKQNQLTFIIGPNGSGKSTLIKLLLGANIPSTGNISFFGKSYSRPAKLSSLIGYIPQEQSLDKEMWVTDILDFIASCHGLHGNYYREYKSKLVQRLEIEDLLNKRIKQLSGGQKQLVNVMIGLLHQPEVILLDEPFVGLDYFKKNKLISTLKNLNKTIICVSHDMAVAEQHADQVIVLNEGEIVEQEDPKILVKNNRFVIKEIGLKKEKTSLELNFSHEIRVNKGHGAIILSYPSNENNRNEINRFLDRNEESITSVNTIQNNLQSTIVGLHNLKFSLTQGKQKGNGKRGKRNKV